MTSIGKITLKDDEETGNPPVTREVILKIIEIFWVTFGVAPTIREIITISERTFNAADENGYEKPRAISSTSVVTYHLKKLREEGKITWMPGMARTIRRINV